MSGSAIRLALRRLRRDRSVTSIALVILALGLGANTALFSVIDAVLLRPLPYPAADRLVVLRLFDPEFQERYPSFPVNAAHIAAWREHCASCEDLAATNTWTTTLTANGEAEQLDGASVSVSFFVLFGDSPDARAVDRPVCSHRRRAAHRVRQSGKPAAGAVVGTPAGRGGPNGPRCGARRARD
jgi:hypothetical protein